MTGAKMTGRRTGRGVLARLEALEAQEAARVQAVGEEKARQIGDALDRLSKEDREAFEDAGRVMEEGLDPDTLARMVAASEHMPEVPPIEDPLRGDALAWADAALDVADGAPFLRPPAGRAASYARFFERCALWCEDTGRASPSPDVGRLARWGAAFWRLEAALCEVLGGQA